MVNYNLLTLNISLSDMNKAELIQLIRTELGEGTTTKTATEALNATLSAISKAVANKEKVQIIGFGTFEPKERPARTGRNPRTGEQVSIPASSTVAFKPAAALKS